MKKSLLMLISKTKVRRFRRSFLPVFICIVLLAGLFPISVTAASNYTMANEDSASLIGNISYEGQTYNVFKIQLDTNQYDSLTLYKVGLTEIVETAAAPAGTTYTNIAKGNEAYTAGKNYYLNFSENFDESIISNLDNDSEQL
jgi:hypothetical protein